MVEVTVSIDVRRPADEAFAFLADWSNNPQWQKGMKACVWTSEPPLRIGSTYDQEASFLGRPIRSSFEVVEYESGRRVRIVTTKSALPLDITRMVDPLPGDRSRITAIVKGEPQGVARFFNPLTRRLVGRSVRADYERLRRLLDGDE